jgi:hypothetical protein
LTKSENSGIFLYGGADMATTLPKPNMGLTFDQVWAIVMENCVQIAETQKTLQAMAAAAEAREAERKKAEAEREAVRAKEAAASKRIFDRAMKQMGDLGNSLGTVIETLLAAKLWEKFDGLGYNFERAYRRIPIYDTGRHALTDIDILLLDGTYAMVVEVKTDMDKKDEIDHHLVRMKRVLKYPPEACRGKILLGAMAGGTVDPDVAAYAHAAGFFVLELTGESVHLKKRPKDFKPQEWPCPAN